jgi:hypothetical protein
MADSGALREENAVVAPDLIAKTIRRIEFGSQPYQMKENAKPLGIGH